jgi:hypothetical protein
MASKQTSAESWKESSFREDVISDPLCQIICAGNSPIAMEFFVSLCEDNSVFARKGTEKA